MSAPAQLPTCIFIAGPARSGRSTLAETLFGEHDGLDVTSFRKPLSGALIGAFFDNDISRLGLSSTLEPEVLDHMIPGLGVTAGGFLPSFKSWLESTYGPKVLGKLAVAHASECLTFFSHIVFDDCDLSLRDEIRIVADFIGHPRCLICNLLPRGDQSQLLKSQTIPTIEILNDFTTPQDLYAMFTTTSQSGELA